MLYYCAHWKMFGQNELGDGSKWLEYFTFLFMIYILWIFYKFKFIHSLEYFNTNVFIILGESETTVVLMDRNYSGTDLLECIYQSNVLENACLNAKNAHYPDLIWKTLINAKFITARLDFSLRVLEHSQSTSLKNNQHGKMNSSVQI